MLMAWPIRMTEKRLLLVSKTKSLYSIATAFKSSTATRLRNANFSCGVFSEFEIYYWGASPGRFVDLLGWEIGRDEKPFVLKAHGHIASMVAGSDGKTLFAGGWDDTVICWNLETKERIGKSSRPDLFHRWLLIPQAHACHCHIRERNRIADGKSMKLIRSILPNASVSAVAFSPDGQSLLVGYGSVVARLQRKTWESSCW